MAQNEKMLTITLTDRRPVRIRKEDWPIIASAKSWDNQYEFQANRLWKLFVRQHDDGRTLVYGCHTSQLQGARDQWGGELLAAGDNIPAAIHRVAASVDSDHIAQECIGDLPTEELNGEAVKEKVYVSALIPAEGADVYGGVRLQVSATLKDAYQDLAEWLEDENAATATVEQIIAALDDAHDNGEILLYKVEAQEFSQ